MLRIPVRKDEDGIGHWTDQVGPEQAGRVARAVCDGKHWYLYDAGEEMPKAHAPAEPEPEKKPDQAV